MMAVYIDKYKMYFWVIVTENHQYITCIPILTHYPIFCSHFPFLPPNRDDELIHTPQYILFIMGSIGISRIGLSPASFFTVFIFLMHTPAPSPKAFAHREALRFFLVRGHRTRVSACTRL